MIESAAGILKIVIFLILGIVFRKTGVLKGREIDGLKKVILYLAIPAVLFLSFSKLKLDLGFIPITVVVFAVNFILFWFGVLLYRLTGSRNRLLPLFLSTMNFSLIGIPLFEAVYGIERLHHYTVFGVGNEIFVWFVFYFMFRRFLSGETAGKKFNTGFIKSPVVWGIVLGCLFSVLKIDISASSNLIVLGVSETITAASKLITPLILVFVGYNISISGSMFKKSLQFVLLRLTAAFAVGYLLKITVLNRFIEDSIYYNSAYFLLISLPAVFSVPILAADYLDDDEMVLLNNTIVLHAVFTIILFAFFVFFISS